MNFQQLEYIIAVNEHRHFAKAAAACHVAQPTLSMMIQKLEKELGIRIFNRETVPVEPTKEGREIILRSRELLLKAKQLKEYAGEMNNENKGALNMGVIPTLAPYLLPLFIPSFTVAFPLLKILIREMQTSEMIAKLKTGELDVGLMSTPPPESKLAGLPLFYEDLYVYVSGDADIQPKKQVKPKEIEIHKLWLLTEGHCLRNQVIDLCGIKAGNKHSAGLHYEAGNIETLINMADKSQGTTILPYLATRMLKKGQSSKLHVFADPVPSREISLVTLKDFPRKKLLENLRASILGTIPDSMRRVNGKTNSATEGQ